MPEMSRFQVAVCSSRLWRAVSGRVVLPWALQGMAPNGAVLEIGAGGGAMARRVLSRYPGAAITATDVDPQMVDVATRRLAQFGDRATVRKADATALPFPDSSFDLVVSCIMLHHTVEWETALAESLRVLRPGGHLVGYDLLAAPPLQMLHRQSGRHLHHAGHHAKAGELRMMTVPELEAVVNELPVDQTRVRRSLGGLVVRFLLRKRP